MQIIVGFFTWINDQLLQMQWLSWLVGLLLENVFGLTSGSQAFGIISFFIVDLIKIFILLSVLIFISSYIQSYFSPERTKKILGRFSGIGANIVGALLGTVTPFCSCSSIPIFIGFTKAGLPIGVTFSFLISSPMIDLASVFLLASIFNWKIALAYVVVGLLIAIIGGTTISALKMEKYVEEFITAKDDNTVELQPLEEVRPSRKQRVKYSFDQVKEIIKKVWIYILIGVGIGALIHGVIPEAWITAILGRNNAFSVLIATGIGIPIYSDIFGTLPIAESLLAKGVGLGTVLAFMLSVTALSLPSLVMIKKVIKWPLLITFVGIIVAGIITMGYLFNAFSYLFI